MSILDFPGEVVLWKRAVVKDPCNVGLRAHLVPSRLLVSSVSAGQVGYLHLPPHAIKDKGV